MDCEVLRLLGAKPDKALENKIACAKAALRTRPRAYHRVFDIAAAGGGVELNSVWLPGKDLAELLAGCTRAIVFAATLGAEADASIRTSQITDISMAVVMDACASAMIEDFCDETQAGFEREYGFLTDRYSPGYGDLPLETQRTIINMLDAQRTLGLHLTNELLLVPSKSVTAIIGIADSPRAHRPRCAGCNMKDCPARREHE